MFSVPNNYNWQCSNEGKKKLDVEKITLEAKDWETIIHLPKKTYVCNVIWSPNYCTKGSFKRLLSFKTTLNDKLTILFIKSQRMEYCNHAHKKINTNLRVDLHSVHLKHVLWNTFLSADNFSIGYTVLLHDSHFSCCGGPQRPILC